MVEQWRPIKQKFDEMYERFIEHIEQRGVEIPDSGILAGPVCPVRPMIEAGQIRWRDMGWDNAHFPLDYRLLMRTAPGLDTHAADVPGADCRLLDQNSGICPSAWGGCTVQGGREACGG